MVGRYKRYMIMILDIKKIIRKEEA